MRDSAEIVELGALRRERILELLATHGRVTASELAERFGVSDDTVRRDLQELAAAGALRRVRGGALPAPRVPHRFADRTDRDLGGKAAIAAAARDLITGAPVAALGGGTTVLAFAGQLPSQYRGTVLTVSPDVALALAEHPGADVVLPGGRLDAQTRTLVGAETVRAFEGVRSAVAVLGACSLHPTAGLSAVHREEAEVLRAIVAGAGRVVVLAGREKLGTAGPWPVAPLERLEVVVTEGAEDDELAVYRDLGVEIIAA
jgi:DeoR/GlpR family transcriptional regulator of sugar metabolism